ncbi:hypothetical protein [Microbacterium sp. J1-1]|uniref:hypothetical protein n=1 Tax=Microbacterium sp. J1-1 TaxID=2992441 RepID=UPI0021146D5B|nr:hypothetical protein [Microbacterium sp. J1-1]UUE19301.1 hypothetical protein LRQ07_10795 [Microbacterium sp. J1-1]
MTTSASVVQRPVRRRLPWVLMLLATVLTLGTVAFIWLVAVPVGPLVCAAVDPPTSNCFLSHRQGSALVMTVIVIAVYLLALLPALLRRARGVLVVGVVLLASAPFVSYAVVAWAPGFAMA